MIEVIAIAAIKSITNYFVTAYLKNNYGSLEIEGAPYWFGREPSGEICVSDAKKGGVLELDKEKKIVKIKLQEKLSNIVENAIHSDKKFSNLKPKEEKFLESIIKDKKIKWFVDSKGYYKNIKIDEDKNMIFIRMCVKQEDFIKYETKRIQEISKEVTWHKADEAFKTLEGEKTPADNREDKAFEELDKDNF